MMKRNISVTIDEKIIRKLDKLAVQTERNRSWLITKAIEAYLEELEDFELAKDRLSDERLSPAVLRKAR